MRRYSKNAERAYIISGSTKLCKEANGVDERITVTVQFITCFWTKKQGDTRKITPPPEPEQSTRLPRFVKRPLRLALRYYFLGSRAVCESSSPAETQPPRKGISSFAPRVRTGSSTGSGDSGPTSVCTALLVSRSRPRVRVHCPSSR